MRVILTQDVQNLGDMGEVVRVSPGYGRNYLVPQGLALPANERNARQFKHQIEQVERKKARLREAALEVVGKLTGTSVTIPRQVGEGDRLFGSVNTRDIEAALEAEGFEIDRRKIQVDKPIRELGVYRVNIKLHSDVRADIHVWVTAI